MRTFGSHFAFPSILTSLPSGIESLKDVSNALQSANYRKNISLHCKPHRDSLRLHQSFKMIPLYVSPNWILQWAFMQQPRCYHDSLWPSFSLIYGTKLYRNGKSQKSIGLCVWWHSIWSLTSACVVPCENPSIHSVCSLWCTLTGNSWNQCTLMSTTEALEELMKLRVSSRFTILTFSWILFRNIACIYKPFQCVVSKGRSIVNKVHVLGENDEISSLCSYWRVWT